MIINNPKKDVERQLFASFQDRLPSAPHHCSPHLLWGARRHKVSSIVKRGIENQ